MTIWVLENEWFIEYEGSGMETLGVYSSYENAAKSMINAVTYGGYKEKDLTITVRTMDEAW
jgi:hypothetical protein